MKYKCKLFIKEGVTGRTYERIVDKLYDDESSMIVDIATRKIVQAQENVLTHEVIPVIVPSKIEGIVGKDIDINFISKYFGNKVTIIFE